MKKLPMTPDDTFIKIALNTNKEEDTLSEAELNTLTDTIETFSITESDQLNLSAKPDNQTKKENKNYEFKNLELKELSCTPNTIYAHKNKNIEILENKHLNKKLHKIEMSDDIQIIEKKDKCTELIKKVDDFLTRKVEVLESKRVLVDRNTGRENLKCVSEPVLCSFEFNEKENLSCEKESINFEEESNFKFTQSNNDIEILKNSTFNNVEFNEEFNVLEMNQESDTQFYLNKLIEENKSINKHRIKELVYCLQTIFKIERFRTNQLEIINTVLENKDTFVLMPTGGGKSLCYQLPVLLEERVSIVISPLIALIKDQVESLLRLDIPAVAFYGSMKKNDRETCFNLLEEWIEGRGLVKIFYVTPELLNSSTRLESILSKIKVRFVIDEVHCLTQWGNDFRPDYLSLELKKFNAPILCLTATATPSVLKKICENLKITPKIFTQSFLRSNLIYKIKNKSDLKGKSLKDAVIKDIVSFITVYYKDCSGIIYCISKKECEELCSSLNYYNLKTYFYHAGLSSKERESIQTEWSKSNTIMIATIAFGMGINKKDVRFVIHYSIPKNLDCYYQETGRAGRDNLPSECVMYYHYSDRHRIFQMTRSKEVDLVVQLCESDKCRRVKLLEYFNEESKECFLCDICLKKNEKNNKLEYDNKNDKETELILLNYLKNNNSISATKLFKECKISNKIKHSLLRELITKGKIKEKVERNGKYMRTLLYFVK